VEVHVPFGLDDKLTLKKGVTGSQFPDGWPKESFVITNKKTGKKLYLKTSENTFILSLKRSKLN
jgi:hypothetical protein